MKLYENLKKSFQGKHKTYGAHAWQYHHENALTHSAEVFCSNLASRLTVQEVESYTPIIVGVDPGLGSGFKICVLSTRKDGSFLHIVKLKSLKDGVGVVHFMSSRDSSAEQVRDIFSEINLKNVDVVVGTGTGSGERESGR